MAQVPAVERTLRVLELMAGEQSALTLSEIAQRTGIPTASCHAILNTLEANGYAAREVIGRSHYWQATLALYHLGAALVNRLGITEVALPHLRALAETVRCPAHLGVLERKDVMYVAKAPAPVFIQFGTYTGKASPFHLTALGRAIAAYSPAERQAQLLEGLPERFARILAETRERGYAVEDSEENEGVGCVAAPVHDVDGEVCASVGITGFSAELFVDGKVPTATAVLDAAAAVSAELGHAPQAAASAV
jgi:IclR family transcriptional regulator, KDG regulon repressor